MEKEISISNRQEEVAQILQFIEELGVLLNIPSAVTMSIDLAIEEILSCMIRHCYPKEEAGAIRFKAVLGPDVLTFCITDEGAPFDPFQTFDVNNEEVPEERLTKGLGHFLIHHTMDEVTYQSKEGRNVLTLVKRVDAKFKLGPTLETNVYWVDGLVVLDVKGRLDTANASEFNEVIQPLLKKKCLDFIVNCEQLIYISSSGLRSFLLLRKSVRANRGSLVIEAMQPEIKQVFEMTGCASLFHIR